MTLPMSNKKWTKVLPFDRFVGAEATPDVPILQPMASFLLVERGQSKGLWLHMCPREEYHLQHAHATNSLFQYHIL